MKIKFDECNIRQQMDWEKHKKASREIIEILKNNNLSIAETKMIFTDILEKIAFMPIN